MTDVVAVRAEDVADLARFLATFPDESRSEAAWRARMRMWWEDNPAFAAEVPRGSMARDAAGRVVGFLGNVPSMFKLGTNELRVMNASTWRVDPAHRAISMRLYIAHLEAAERTMSFNTTANATVQRALEYFHFEALPSYASARTFYVALNASQTCAAYLRGRPLAKLSGMAAAGPLRAAQLPLELRLHAASRRRVRVLASAGAAFDELWSRSRHLYENTSVRSAARLEWLCFHSAQEGKVLVGRFDGAGDQERLRGFAVFTPSTMRGLKVLELVDLWTDAREPSLARSLIGGGWREGRKRGFDILALHDYAPWLTRVFDTLPVPFKVPDEHKHWLYYGEELRLPAAKPESSYLTALEGDLAV